MKTSYMASTGGRLMAGTAAFALLMAAAQAVLGRGSHEIVFLSIVPVLCIVGCFFGVGLSTETHGGHAAVLVVVMPIVAGPYLALLVIAPRAGLALAPVLALPGLILATIAIVGSRLLVQPGSDTTALATGARGRSH
jgi:hypothetical protein